MAYTLTEIRSALEWYRDEAEAAKRATENMNADSMAAILTVMSNDNGNRAKKALDILELALVVLNIKEEKYD